MGFTSLIGVVGASYLLACSKLAVKCVLDEMGAPRLQHGQMGGGSSSNNISVGERLLSTLLTEMDGLEQAKGILVLAATKRPHAIDDALMRPGRFDKVRVYMGDGWYLDFGRTHFGIYSPPDFYTRMICSNTFLYAMNRGRIISFTAGESWVVSENTSSFVPVKTLVHTLPLSLSYLLYMLASMESVRGVIVPMYTTLRRTTVHCSSRVQLCSMLTVKVLLAQVALDLLLLLKKSPMGSTRATLLLSSLEEPVGLVWRRLESWHFAGLR